MVSRQLQILEARQKEEGFPNSAQVKKLLKIDQAEIAQQHSSPLSECRPIIIRGDEHFPNFVIFAIPDVKSQYRYYCFNETNARKGSSNAVFKGYSVDADTGVIDLDPDATQWAIRRSLDVNENRHVFFNKANTQARLLNRLWQRGAILSTGTYYFPEHTREEKESENPTTPPEDARVCALQEFTREDMDIFQLLIKGIKSSQKLGNAHLRTALTNFNKVAKKYKSDLSFLTRVLFNQKEIDALMAWFIEKKHPELAQALIETPHTRYTLTEFIKGFDLDQRNDASKPLVYQLSLEERIELGLRLIVEVDRLHDQEGMIHGDLKPNNIRIFWDALNSKYDITILDFDNAAPIGVSAFPDRLCHQYAAPEVLMASATREKIPAHPGRDSYALLGVMAFLLGAENLLQEKNEQVRLWHTERNELLGKYRDGANGSFCEQALKVLDQKYAELIARAPYNFDGMLNQLSAEQQKLLKPVVELFLKRREENDPAERPSAKESFQFFSALIQFLKIDKEYKQKPKFSEEKATIVSLKKEAWSEQENMLKTRMIRACVEMVLLAKGIDTRGVENFLCDKNMDILGQIFDKNAYPEAIDLLGTFLKTMQAKGNNAIEAVEDDILNKHACQHERFNQKLVKTDQNIDTNVTTSFNTLGTLVALPSSHAQDTDTVRRHRSAIPSEVHSKPRVAGQEELAEFIRCYKREIRFSDSPWLLFSRSSFGKKLLTGKIQALDEVKRYVVAHPGGAASKALAGMSKRH